MITCCTRISALCCLLLGGWSAAPAMAEEDLTAAVAMTAVTVSESPEAPAPAPRVTLAVPVGNVMLGADNHAGGGQRYAARVDAAGSGMVSFTTRRPSIAIRLPEGASAPAGLPLASARLTSSFGARRNPVTGFWRNHGGIDLGAPTGTPVAVTGNGTVTFAGFAGSYGLLVVVDHGNGMQTRYAHLSRIGVARGQAVRQGDTVGLVGSTGRSTGPHLHYEVRSGGQALNPLAH